MANSVGRGGDGRASSGEYSYANAAGSNESQNSCTDGHLHRDSVFWTTVYCRQQKEEIQNKKKESDSHYISWNSENDPLNSQNWGYPKKESVLILVLGIILIVAFFSSVSPAQTPKL